MTVLLFHYFCKAIDMFVNILLFIYVCLLCACMCLCECMNWMFCITLSVQDFFTYIVPLFSAYSNIIFDISFKSMQTVYLAVLSESCLPCQSESNTSQLLMSHVCRRGDVAPIVYEQLPSDVTCTLHNKIHRKQIAEYNNINSQNRISQSFSSNKENVQHRTKQLIFQFHQAT